MEKRYQVFVSSTYADLKEERQHVMQTLMEMDCIPAGMELFPAADEEQLNFIKKIIDDSDYYLLIIGGRYGTTTSEGISYTEKEYNYALEKDLKVIALVHKNPEELAVNKTDNDPTAAQKLRDFTDRVKTGRLVKFWSSPDQLPGMVALSLAKTIKTYPAIGWVRANIASSSEQIKEVNDLRRRNDQLSEKISELSDRNSADLSEMASMDDEFELIYSDMGDGGSRRVYKTTWRNLFSTIGPYILSTPDDAQVKSKITEIIDNYVGGKGYVVWISDNAFETIKIQYMAYGVIAMGDSVDNYWVITEYGKKIMLESRIVRAGKSVVA